MTNNKKIAATLLISGSVILLLVFFAIGPILNQIKKESENFMVQKRELVESEAKIKNIRDFMNNFKQYQPNLKKIDSLYADAAEPVEFIEFLEKEAAVSRLSIEIFPSSASEFNLKLEGSFPNFLRFIERLEYGSYLVETINLSIRKIPDKKDVISAALLIKTPAK